MPKIKNNLLFIVPSILAIVIIFSFVSFAVAKNETSAGNNANNQVGSVNAEEHRSTVANFVQTLLETASNTEDGIGQQVRVVAQQQNQSVTTTIQAIEKVQTRSKVKTFFFGSDYKNLGTLRSEMVQTKNRLEQLSRLMENIQNESETTELQNQIQTLEQERTKIENFITAEEGKFSLFGWFVKLFN
jgi:predicted  nucleic acid-binding Zn-ribbon protein